MKFKINNSKLIMITVLCLLFAGCQPGNTRKDKIDYTPIAGTWKADRSPYLIRIGEDAVLKWAVVDPGAVQAFPNQQVEFKMKDDSKGFFEVGDCPVIFNPDTGELSVEINVDKLMIPFPNDKLEGKVQHTFTGFLSDDSMTWDTTWFEVFDYGPRFPMPTEDEFIGIPVRFTRIEK